MGLLSNFRHKFHNAFFPQVLYGTIASLAIFLTSWDHLDRMRDRLNSKLQNDTDTFDFVVVGGGTAGSIVASKLSEYYSVLLLEAGGEPHPLQAVPGLAMFMPNHPEIDWMHNSVPQKRAFGNSIRREASLSQGKGLGGSANLNFLNYLRGSPLDYEHWKNITHDKSWGYSEMRKYFSMVEDYSKEPVQNNNHKYGAVKIDIPDYIGLSEEFITAGHQFGYNHVDLNNEFVEGFDVNYLPIFKGVRQGPYQSYLKPARNRKSLTIRKFSNVNRILFRENSTHAYAVEYERHGELKLAKATKEIILSAGALATPKILMLSGVGPTEHLQDAGIPLRLDLPVGRNLQDHISTLVGPFFIREPRALLVGKDIDTGSFLAWGMEGKGPLTSSFYQASGLILSSFAKSREEDRGWADIHLQLSSIAIHKTYAQDLAHAYNLQENLMTQYYNHAAGKQSFSIGITNGRPIARGEVLLSGREPKDKLMINPKYLEDSSGLDVQIMKDGIKTALKMAENSTSFQKLGTHFTDRRLPGCEHVEFRSDAYWECYIRQFSFSMHDYCGTAAMGKASSKFAVVDPELKVIGAKGLRVVDGSIMPSIPVGSPMAAILAIGEKGSDMILRYWRQFDVPSKKSEGETTRKVETKPAIISKESESDNDFTDSFSAFSYIGKVIPRTNDNRNGSAGNSKPNTRKQQQPKQKTKSSQRQTVKVTTSTTTTTSTQKPSDFDQAESRFSHNLNQIMEFLRNSRAINEAIDDETYNELVQNFGDRIVEFMKKNKTDIFFVPVTTTTTSTEKPLTTPTKDRKQSATATSTSTSTTTLRPSSSPKPSQLGTSVKKTSLNSFSVNTPNSKFSFGKATEERRQSQQTSPKNAKQYEPFQFSTTSRPHPSQITTLSRKLSTYFFNGNANFNQKPVKITTPIPKKIHQLSSPPQVVKSTSSPKFSPLILNSDVSKKPTTVVTSLPKKLITTTTSIASSSSPSSTTATDATNLSIPEEEGQIEETEDTTASSDEEETTEQAENEDPTTTTTAKPKQKVVEYILNPDLTLNKIKEINENDPIIYSSTGKKNNSEYHLVEYKTEEVRPYPSYPPYRIVPVPGQEFFSNERLVSPSVLASYSPILVQSSPGIALLTPPPPQQHHFNHLNLNQHQLQGGAVIRNQQQNPQFQINKLPPFIPQFQQLTPSKIPGLIDENLPIQTAKTVLYYSTVHSLDQNNKGQVSSSSSSFSPSNFHREQDPSQNIVQFVPSIN